jgi:TRAP-type C4-dicarboxylate transport system permease small subunit
MVINMETSSAVMEVPMAIFYGAGGTASVLVFLILVNQLWKLLTGTLSENELVGIRESEDEPVEFSGPVK